MRRYRIEIRLVEIRDNQKKDLRYYETPTITMEHLAYKTQEKLQGVAKHLTNGNPQSAVEEIKKYRGK